MLYWYIPVDSAETSTELLEQVKKERGYNNEDQLDYSPWAAAAPVLAAHSREHSFTDEIAQMVSEGEAWVDVRDGAADLWVRLHVTKGDCVVLPSGMQHRVSLVPNAQPLVARRLFKGAPKVMKNTLEYLFPITFNFVLIDQLDSLLIFYQLDPVFRFSVASDDQEETTSAPPAYGFDSLSGDSNPRDVIPQVCAQFYRLGWVSGTGGGMAIKHGQRYFMAPSGVMKEALTPEMMYVLDSAGTVLEHPQQHSAQPPLKLSECAPLFMHAFDIRQAGAVLHSHSLNVVMATLIDEDADEFVVSHQEMIKGIAGHRFDEQLVIPIIENTPRESNLADLLAAAIKAYPKSPAVLVRRHGVYVWGKTWKQAKTQAECLDYLCHWAVEMKKAGLNPAQNPFTDPAKQGKVLAWCMDPLQEARGVDCRQPHQCVPNQPVNQSELEALGVLQWRLDADKHETDPVLADLRKQRGYTYHDLITVSPDRLPNYEAKIKSFFEEHLHTDEEIRYVLDGSGYFDVRSACDTAWVRIHLKKGDLITLPAGIYHRFTLDTRQYIKALRLFVGEPVWTAYNRSPDADVMPARTAYTAAFPVVKSSNGGSMATEGAKKRSATVAGLGGGGPNGMPSIGDYATNVVPAANTTTPMAASGGVLPLNSPNAKKAKPVVTRGKYAAVVLDIEGTTTPITFVKDKLFPYAGANVASFLDQEWESALVQSDVALLRAQASKDKEDANLLATLPGFVDVSTEVAAASGGDTSSKKAANIAALVANVQWQIRHNRKTGALKTLQGHLWKSGYEKGALQGEMYKDVLPALQKWHASQLPVYIYSSGSRQAQRLIFGYSNEGDLRPLLAGYLDTNVGGKMEPSSYGQILETIGVEDASRVLFATDLLGEAEAASAAGLDAVLMLRPGNAPLPAHNFATAHSFDEFFPSDKQ